MLPACLPAVSLHANDRHNPHHPPTPACFTARRSPGRTHRHASNRPACAPAHTSRTHRLTALPCLQDWTASSTEPPCHTQPLLKKHNPLHGTMKVNVRHKPNSTVHQKAAQMLPISVAAEQQSCKDAGRPTSGAHPRARQRPDMGGGHHKSCCCHMSCCCQPDTVLARQRRRRRPNKRAHHTTRTTPGAADPQACSLKHYPSSSVASKPTTCLKCAAPSGATHTC